MVTPAAGSVPYMQDSWMELWAHVRDEAVDGSSSAHALCACIAPSLCHRKQQQPKLLSLKDHQQDSVGGSASDRIAWKHPGYVLYKVSDFSVFM